MAGQHPAQPQSFECIPAFDYRRSAL